MTGPRTREQAARLLLFTVLDDSNAGPADGYRPGQVVYIDPDIEPAVGCDVVATLPGGHRLGRLQEDGQGRYLLLLNPARAERVLRLPAGLAPRGVVVGVFTSEDDEPEPRQWVPVVGVAVPASGGIEASRPVRLPAVETREEAQAIALDAMQTVPGAVCCTAEPVRDGQIEPLAEVASGAGS